jgi:hypothetical protein
MEPEVRFAQIEALLHAMAERENQMEIRFNHRTDAWESRMQAWEKRMERSEQRMDKFDLRLEATRRLIEAGMRILLDLGKRHAELEKSQKAFLDSLRRAGNGNGRGRV